MNIVYQHRTYFPDRTESEVRLPSGTTIHALERPWLNNRQNVSCIPPDIYLVKWLERSGSGKYRRVWHVQNVEGRSGILWHAGNLVRHTLGCELPGLKFGKMEELPAIFFSLAALNKMREELSGQDFMLVIY